MASGEEREVALDALRSGRGGRDYSGEVPYLWSLLAPQFKVTAHPNPWKQLQAWYDRMDRMGRAVGSSCEGAGMSTSEAMGGGMGRGTEDLRDLLTGLEAIIHQLPTALLVMEAGTYRIVLQSERVARIWRISPAEVRVGIITAFFGAPFFLFLLIRNKSRAGMI